MTGFSLSAKLALYASILATCVGLAWRVYYKIDQGGYNRHKAETEAARELQREGNRGRAYQAEAKQAQKTEVRIKYITQIEKELRNESKTISSCPIGTYTIGLLNAAASCAIQDRPSACGASD